MSARDNEAIVRELHEAFNARDLDRAAAYATEDAEYLTVATGETLHGPEGYKRYMQNWIDAFSDASTEITAIHAGDNFAVVEFTGRGTHDGTLRSPAGEVPPTGRVTENRFCEVVHIQRFAEEQIFGDATRFLHPVDNGTLDAEAPRNDGSVVSRNALGNGKVSRSRTYLDLATMLTQLGVMPAPEGAAG